MLSGDPNTLIFWKPGISPGFRRTQQGAQPLPRKLVTCDFETEIPQQREFWDAPSRQNPAPSGPITAPAISRHPDLSSRLNCAPRKDQNTGPNKAGNEIAEPPTERDAK